jgi:proline iminopeptidase
VLLVGCLSPDDPGNLVPKTVDDDPSLPSIAVNDTLLHAEAFGNPSAPMIVFLHGGPGGDYRGMLPYRVLADEGYYTVFWDNRGAGLSRRHPPSSYSDFGPYLEDLRQVIEHFTTSSQQLIVFIGHSWGAMYATWFINEYGDYGGRVAGAVLAEPGAFTSADLKAYDSRFFPPWSFTSEEMNDVLWADPIVSKASQERADYAVQIANLAGFPREHNDPNNPLPLWRAGAVVQARLNQVGLDKGFDWTTHLGDYHHKVLFLRGELNENLPLSNQQEKASHFPQAEIVTIPGVGHQNLWERQAESLAQIRPYLAEVAPVTGGAL